MSGRNDWHGERFLYRKDVARRLLDSASISRGDFVVEIGSGTGRLTAALVERGARVVAYEIDPALVRRLRARLGQTPGVLIRHVDFLRAELPRCAYKVVSNLPFDRTSEIVRRLLAARPPPTEAVLIVQREAALRYAGHPYRHETLVSLLLKPWWCVQVVGRVPGFAFRPPPRVAVAVLRLARRESALVAPSTARLYRDFVTFAFASPGPTVEANLRHVFTRTQMRRLRRELPVRLDRPPSDVPFAQWLDMFDRFARYASEARRHAVLGSHRRLTRRNVKRRRAARPRGMFEDSTHRDRAGPART